jgi:biofilm PGA synthesis N-glycosyltransferase PgaC
MHEGALLILIGTLGVLTVTLLYPLCLLLLPVQRKSVPPPPALPEIWPRVTVITGVHNAGDLLPAKIENFKALDYPQDHLSLIIASDASTDRSYDRVLSTNDTRIRWIEQPERQGKAAALNLAAEEAHADLLLFSDVDAMLDPQAIRQLTRHFSTPRVGAVCGQRIPANSTTSLRNAQATYIKLDSAIKQAESAWGKITSNDGKIHMIRSSLFSPIPSDVTDDLYTALAIIAQGYDVRFEPTATATVRVPSRDVRDEIQRRRRIVTRSLTGILRKRGLLNPLQFGWFSVGLLINKVGRRVLPFFVLAILAGLVRYAATSHHPLPLAITAIGLTAAAIVFHGIASHYQFRLTLKIFSLAQYATAGLTGTAWGVVDFLLGRRVSVWEPSQAGYRQRTP